MPDYKKLVKALRNIEKTMFALGTRPINMDNVSIRLAYDKEWGRTAKDAADAIEALQAASPWHSMEDNGPPEENGPYFVYAPSYRGGSSSEKERARGVMISKWTGKHWSIEVGYYKRPGCVTHWMPIEPPKEDA